MLPELPQATDIRLPDLILWPYKEEKEHLCSCLTSLLRIGLSLPRVTHKASVWPEIQSLEWELGKRAKGLCALWLLAHDLLLV